MTLDKQVTALGINAFICVYYAVQKDNTLAWKLDNDEERMFDIDELINESAEEDSELMTILTDFASKGVSNIVLAKGW